MKAATETAGQRYRCPACKREATVLLSTISVRCCRCGRDMKRVPGRPHG